MISRKRIVIKKFEVEKLTDLQVEKLLRNKGISKKTIKLIPGLLQIQRAVIELKQNKQTSLKAAGMSLLDLVEVASQTAHCLDYKPWVVAHEPSSIRHTI